MICDLNMIKTGATWIFHQMHDRLKDRLTKLQKLCAYDHLFSCLGASKSNTLTRYQWTMVQGHYAPTLFSH